MITGAVEGIAATREFNRHLTELTGWKNLKSWVRWAGRSLEPAMLAKMRWTAITEGLTAEMLAAGTRQAYFAERFLEEMVLICLAEQDKTDVRFVVGEAFTLFGPLLAPFSAAAGAAAGGGIAAMATKGAISTGQKLAQMGVTAGGKALAVDPALSAGMASGSSLAPIGFVTEDWAIPATRGRSSAVYSAPTAADLSSIATAEERYHYSVNPMQYALCLFKYLTNLSRPSSSEQLVIGEFGGAAKLQALYEFIKHPDL
jgi:hypothetical protein